eukprot:30294-Pelagococcus_subviridis.AAC.107
MNLSSDRRAFIRGSTVKYAAFASADAAGRVFGASAVMYCTTSAAACASSPFSAGPFPARLNAFLYSDTDSDASATPNHRVPPVTSS